MPLLEMSVQNLTLRRLKDYYPDIDERPDTGIELYTREDVEANGYLWAGFEIEPGRARMLPFMRPRDVTIGNVTYKAGVRSEQLIHSRYYYQVTGNTLLHVFYVREVTP